MTYPALLPRDRIAVLRDALLRADYTADGIAGRLGPDATAAATRNDFRAALRATEDRDPLATLIRLFVCGQAEREADIARAFGDRGTLADARAAGLLRTDDESISGGASHDGDAYRAGLDLEPYGGYGWVISDLPSHRQSGPLAADHVLGVGAASETLANAIIRDPIDYALDLGAGCGVQALRLSTHARRVVATDISERALRFAATTAALSGLAWDLRRGDMTAPVAGERFDLIVSNPPFVVGPGVATHAYRDSGRPGDAICRDLAKAAPGLLADGGTLQFLANWAHVAGEDWAERVTGWFAGSGMDVWVIQREITDPASYVDLWLADAAEDDPRRAAAWLDWFDAQRVQAIGFGLITAKNNHHHDPVVRAETLRQSVAHPFGPQVKAWFGRQDWLRGQSLEDILDTRYRASAGLTLRQDATLGAEGWDVATQHLTQTSGLGWTEEVDPVTLALVGGANGEVALREQLAVLEAAYQVATGALTGAAGVIVAHLVERGFLEPVTAAQP